MLGMNYRLEALERQGAPILAGIVGAGQMGRGLVAQMLSMKGMRPAIVADIEPERAVKAFESAGLAEGKDFCAADTPEQAERLLAQNIWAVTANSELATSCGAIRCVVDATGVPEAGAKIAMDAIEHKKHIVMLNVETDVCIGHILWRLATEAGVVYTGSAGDEPGAVMELYDFASALGFDVRVIGKGKNNKVNCEATPDTAAAEAARKGLSPRMLCSFQDGTKTMVELTAMANATGFAPDIPGAHGPKGTVRELPDILSLQSEGRGGILSSYRVVEYVDGVAPGVFAVIASDRPDVIHELGYLSMGDGPNYILYRPYHLCSLETPLSVARAVLDSAPTIIPRAGHVAETAAVAKRDLKAGEALDGIGGYTVRGTVLSSAAAKAQNALPLGLVDHKTTVKRDIARGSLLTYGDVTADEASLVWRLRKRQDEMFCMRARP